jgi:recombination protein RecA
MARKKDDIDAIKEKLRDKFGNDFVMGDNEKVEVISTGFLEFDEALGVGGLARGRIVEIFGPNYSGKTSLSLAIIGNAQKKGVRCAFIDAEHALHRPFCHLLGVNTDDLTVVRPMSGEDALEAIEMLISSKLIDLVVVDSVAAMVPKAELEGDFGKATMGGHARLMSQAMRKLVGLVDKHKVVLIFINQIRSTLAMFGNPIVTTGGQGLRFYSSLRLDIANKGPHKDKDVGTGIIGNKFRVKIVKNKLGDPLKEIHFKIVNGEGISIDTKYKEDSD